MPTETATIPTYNPDADNQFDTDRFGNYSYDNAGILTGKDMLDESVRWEYVHDHRRRLIEASKHDDEDDIVLHAEYKYGVFGRRVGNCVEVFSRLRCKS